MDPAQWPSLRDEIALAEELFGGDGFRMVSQWLASEAARVDDDAFARQFTDHIELPGVVGGDFTHRHIRTSRGALLGGIRFYGRDVGRPFVEVICHDFDDLGDLADCVRAEWSMFAPLALRLRARPGRLFGPNVTLDHTIHAARYRDMTLPDGRVSLEMFGNAEEAVAVVARRYAALAADDPALAHNVRAADPEDVRLWHTTGLLYAIRVRRVAVGALAIGPGRINWIEGDEINEEVVDKPYAGAGYAAAAQAAWAHYVALQPDRLLIGTIDRLNTASRKTAERAGRARVLDAVFVSLTR